MHSAHRTKRHMTGPHPQIAYSLGDSAKQRNVLCPKNFLLLQPDCPESHSLLTSVICALLAPSAPFHCGNPPTGNPRAAALPCLLDSTGTGGSSCLTRVSDITSHWLPQAHTGSSGGAVINPFRLKRALQCFTEHLQIRYLVLAITLYCLCLTR